jgi:hypothetical protein
MDGGVADTAHANTPVVHQRPVQHDAHNQSLRKEATSTLDGLVTDPKCAIPTLERNSAFCSPRWRMRDGMRRRRIGLRFQGRPLS